MAVEDLRWWTGSEWVSVKDFNSDSLPPGTAEGQLLQWDGSGWAAAGEGTAEGQLLVWDDTNKRWLPMAYTGTDGNGKPIKPILPIGSEDGTVMLADYAGSFSVQDTSSPGSPDPIATFHPATKPTMAGMMLKQSWLTQDGKVLMWEPGTSREPIIPTDDAQAVPKKYVDDLVADSVADHKLPTESVDGTVVLDSPAADTFTIETAGTERVRVQGDGKVGIGNNHDQNSASLLIRRPQDAVSVIRMDAPAPTAAGSYYGVLSAPTMTGASSSTYAHFTASESGTGDFAVNYGFLAGDALSGTVEARGFVADLSDGPGRWNIYASGTASNYFAGQCHFNSGSALAPAICHSGDADTGLFFGTGTFAISTDGNERLRVNKSGVLVGGDVATAPAASIPGIAWHSGATGFASQIQFRLSDNSRHYGYLGMTQPEFAVGGANALLDGGVTYVGCEYRNLVLFANAGEIVFAVGGLANASERLRITAQGHITAAATYYPVVEQDLATRKYVDDQMALVGGASVTTADVNLTNPTRSLGRFTPPADLATQEDANQAIGDAIAERKIVLPISRAEYDALPVKDPATLYLITS